jgi:septal ring factor EnvC (AmiA/AmiB activator)
VKDETWWRQRIGQLRDSLRRNEILAEALQTRINALTNDFASRDDPHQRARIADDRQKATAELDRVRSEIELQKRKTGEIEDEARRAGVPPGWLR